jgi:hypothetical protein
MATSDGILEALGLAPHDGSKGQPVARLLSNESLLSHYAARRSAVRRYALMRCSSLAVATFARRSCATGTCSSRTAAVDSPSGMNHLLEGCILSLQVVETQEMRELHGIYEEIFAGYGEFDGDRLSGLLRLFLYKEKEDDVRNALASVIIRDAMCTYAQFGGKKGFGELGDAATRKAYLAARDAVIRQSQSAVMASLPASGTASVLVVINCMAFADAANLQRVATRVFVVGVVEVARSHVASHQAADRYDTPLMQLIAVALGGHFGIRGGTAEQRQRFANKKGYGSLRSTFSLARDSSSLYGMSLLCARASERLQVAARAAAHRHSDAPTIDATPEVVDAILDLDRSTMGGDPTILQDLWAGGENFVVYEP